MRPTVRVLAVLALCAISIAPAVAQTDDPHASPADTVSSRVDWSSGIVSVTVERPVTASGPAAVAQTQRAIRRDAPGIVLDVLAGIPYDSYHTVGSLVSGEEQLITALERAAARATPVEASPSADLQTARVTFEIDLYSDLATQFISHGRSAPIESRLGFTPHVDYTGILIYAADELPLFGTDQRVLPAPALFPGLYYLREPGGQLYRLVEREHFDPVQLERTGPVGYTSDVQAVGMGDRLGPRPLRLLAIGVFGRNGTDLVLSEEDARQITVSEHNRDLLRSGRVVIVVSPDQL